MAKFNPDVPETQAPTYFGLSHPISDMQGDTSTGVALKGAGDIFHSAAVGADTVVKSIIDQAVYKQTDEASGNQLGALEEAAGVDPAIRTGNPMPYTPPEVLPTAPEKTTGLIPGATAAPVPAQLVQATEAPLQTAGAAYMSGAKGALGLYYHNNLDIIAKNLRSQFPGYRDYIDAKMSQATGGEYSANAYMRNLQTVLQSSLSQNKSDTEHALSELSKEDVQDMPGVNKLIADVNSGNTGGMNPRAYVMLHTSGWRAINARAQKAAAVRESFKFDQDQEFKTADKDLTRLGYDMINQKMVTVFGQDLNFKQFQDMVGGLQSGKITASGPELEQVKQVVHMFRDSLYNDIYKKASTREPGTSRSISEILGKNAESNITSTLQGVDLIVKNVGDKDFGAASAVGRALTSLTHDDAWRLATNANMDVQKWVRTAAALNTAAGPNAISKITADAAAANVTTPMLNSIVDGHKMGISIGNVDANLTASIRDLKKAGIGIGNTPSDKSDRAVYDRVTNLPDVITDPTIPAPIIQNIITGSYGPGNEKLIDEFKPDMVDAKGKRVGGQMAVFTKMTSSDKTDTIWNFNKQHPDSQAWTHYQKWSELTHSKLYTSDMKDLNTLGVNKYVQYSWDSDNSKLAVNFKPEFYTSPVPFINMARLERAIRDKVDNVNVGMSSMINIAKKQGNDPNAYALNLMIAEGFRPDRISNSGQILGAMINSQPPKQEGETKSIGSKVLDAIKPPNLGPFELDNVIQKGSDLFKKGIDAVSGSVVPPAGAGNANAAHSSELWGNPLQKGFKQNHLADITTPSGKKIQVNKVSAEAFSGFLQDLEATGYKIKEIGGYSLRENKAQPGRLSQHAWGNAIDINPSKNPFGSHKTDMPPNVKELAAKHGLVWGGSWRHGDPMHFEYMGPTRTAGK